MQNPWVRTKTGLLAGVCEGIAKRIDAEVWLVRFVWVMTVLFVGTGLLAYIILAVCLPREDKVDKAYDKMLLGVCSRVSRRSDLEPGLVRVCTCLLAGFTGGAAVVAYVALYFLLPEPTSTSTSKIVN